MAAAAAIAAGSAGSRTPPTTTVGEHAPPPCWPISVHVTSTVTASPGCNRIGVTHCWTASKPSTLSRLYVSPMLPTRTRTTPWSPNGFCTSRSVTSSVLSAGTVYWLVCCSPRGTSVGRLALKFVPTGSAGSGGVTIAAVVVGGGSGSSPAATGTATVVTVTGSRSVDGTLRGAVDVRRDDPEPRTGQRTEDEQQREQAWQQALRDHRRLHQRRLPGRPCRCPAGRRRRGTGSTGTAAPTAASQRAPSAGSARCRPVRRRPPAGRSRRRAGATGR